MFPVNFLDMDQGSPEWLAVRVGMVTSSRVAAAISRLKRTSKNGGPGDPSAARINLRTEIVGELLSGKLSEHYVSYWMERGKELECVARAAYEMETGLSVDQVGFVLHRNIKYAGASPDGVILSRKRLVEFKVPKLETHLRYIHEGVIPEEYRPQMGFQLACAGEEWEANDFVSYCPDLPKYLQTFIVQMPRDNKMIAEYETEVELFWQEVQQMKDEIEARQRGQSVEEFRLTKSIALVKKNKKHERHQQDLRELAGRLAP